MTDERLRRIFVGAPYAVLRYVGLDMWGWVIGTTLFYLTLLGGFFACYMLNCCGAARVIQAVTRRSRDGSANCAREEKDARGPIRGGEDEEHGDRVQRRGGAEHPHVLDDEVAVGLVAAGSELRLFDRFNRFRP